MNIVIANDHGAFELKRKIVDGLESMGHSVINLGVDGDDSVDYPDMAGKAVGEYKRGGYDFGILLCGTGIGISIAANKFEGIRCALPQNIFAAEMAKRHNNANFLAFGGRIHYHDSVMAMIDAFLFAEYEGGRHEGRLKKITTIEKSGL